MKLVRGGGAVQLAVGAWLVCALICVVAAVSGQESAEKAEDRESEIRGDKDVIFYETFEMPDWYKRWGERRPPQNLQLVADNSSKRFGKAVAKILFVKGEHYGSGWSWKIDPPVEEAYLQYWVKFEDGFDFDRGGKTPGLMGWAPGQQAGWGGRRANGTNGFSTRICWGRGGSINMYTYHADQRTEFGDGLRTRTKDGEARWAAGRWYRMEVRMKLNTPGAKPGEQGKHDGIVELWRDGTLIGRETTIRFRDLPTMKIDNLFVNAYFGGTWTCPKDQHIFYDNIILARKYIGDAFDKDDKPKKTRTGKFTAPPGWETK